MADCEHTKLYALDFANQPRLLDGECLFCQRDSILLKLPSGGLVDVWERLPEKNQLVLCYLTGVKGHSDAAWKREGWWLVPWHGTVWAWQFIEAACKHLDADSLEVTHWMPLPEAPK